jgi:two-component system response regulator PfeR
MAPMAAGVSRARDVEEERGSDARAEEAAGPKRLLLVEDDRITSAALKGILTLRGWEVIVATTVAQGTAAVREGRFDAVVLDLVLPDGDGEVVLGELRRRQGDGVAVVVMTGVGEAERIEALTREGPAALLRKPIRLNDLLEGIGSR